MTDESDQDILLMLRVKQGDIVAFESLVEKYKHPVIRIIYRTLKDATEAEDLAQTVFIQVFKSAHRYKPASKFSTWLFTIARNLTLNEIRRRSRHPAESMDAGTSHDEEAPWKQFEDRSNSTPDEQALRNELERKIEEALSQLPENQRTAILLCQNDGLSYEDISDILNCSVSAVKPLIHRGRLVLKTQLKPYLKTGAWTNAH